jgi:hypothetical protein
MESTKLQMDMHKSNSWLYYKLSIHTLGLVLRSGITITSPDPKADAKLQVTSGVHHGGTLKVIVVRLPSNKLGDKLTHPGRPPPHRHNQHEART